MKRVMKNNVPKTWSMADFLEVVGQYFAKAHLDEQVAWAADEGDLLAVLEHENKQCELIDGVLVEKAMGFLEGLLASDLVTAISNFVNPRDLGRVRRRVTHQTGRGLVRLADVAYFSWERLGGESKIPSEPIPQIYPDLAIEVLSKGNTKGEMERKRKDFFFHAVRLVWQVDPKKRFVDVYTSPKEFVRYTESDTLDGGEVFPGFTLSLQELFAGCEPDEPKPPKARPKK